MYIDLPWNAHYLYTFLPLSLSVCLSVYMPGKIYVHSRENLGFLRAFSRWLLPTLIFQGRRNRGGGGARGPCPPNNLHKYALPPPPPKKKKKKKNIFFKKKINLWITPVIFTSMPLKISTIVPYYGFHICALEQFNICAPKITKNPKKTKKKEEKNNKNNKKNYKTKPAWEEQYS